MTSQDVLIGRIIAGKFCIRECIGEGAAGAVYKADQTSLGRTVAVKVLRPELATDPRFIRRFHDEARASSRLNHPNVVSVIDFGQTEDGLLYLVMEYLRGTTLTTVLRSEQLSFERITEIILQILSALEEAHEGGVIHADLKADNIMVEHRRGGWDLIKVVDFGIARLTGNREEDRQEDDGSICGTPEYMAPEVIRGHDPTPAADIYAVGIMLYEILIGYTPFGGVGTYEVLQRHLHEQPVPPSQRAPSRTIPQYLEEAAMCALQKKIEARFSTAAEFATALNLGKRSNVPAGTVQEEITCTECGMVSPIIFKFCPECGISRDSDGPGEFIIPLDDTGHEEIWCDDTPTADLVVIRDGTLVMAKQQKIQQAATQAIVGKTFPMPILGQDAQFSTIAQFATNATTGTLQICGKNGSGRSRLLRDACEKAAAMGQLVFLAKADPTGLSAAFYPIRAIIGAILQLPAISSYEEIASALDDIGLNRRDQPGIGELFQHQGGGLYLLEGPIRRRELFAATIRVLRAGAERTPAVLAFEDFHLYDQPSRDLLGELAQNLGPGLRIILTSDAETSLGWNDLQKVELQPLNNEALRAIVTHFVLRGQPDLVTMNELQTITKGNWGHIEQLLRFATEGGDIPSAPESLADLIAARIDLLPPAAKRVMQASAVFGLEVTTEDLIDTLGSSVGRVEFHGAVTLIENRGMLRSEGGLLSFTHSFTRDVVYEATPLDVRLSLHNAAGDVLIASVSDPAILGVHADLAGSTARAAELLGRAGDNAVKQLDDRGAASLFNRALNATRSLWLAEQAPRTQAQLVAISIKLADALRICGEVGLARGILQEAQGHCSEMPALRAQLLRAAAQLRAAQGDIHGAIAWFREAIALAIPIFALDVLTDSYLDLATMQLRDGDTDGAIRELEEAIDLVTLGEGPAAENAPKTLWRLLLRLTQLHNRAGNTEKAAKLGQHAARLADGREDHVGSARSYATLAGIFEIMGDSDQAQAHRQRAIDSMRELGDRRTTAELLLASSRPTQKFHRITPASIREARLLAEEVGWEEGVRQAHQASTDATDSSMVSKP